MPYPEDELHSTEELILDLHPHWWFFAKSAAMLALAVILAIATLSVSWLSWATVPVALFIFATLVWFVQRYIRWVSTHFVLTSDRVIFRTGIIAKHGIDRARLSYAGVADLSPVASNDSDAGRQRNRRVELTLLVPPGGTVGAAK